MTDAATTDADIRQVWANDRRKAALAARLLVCCLDIQAEAGISLTGPEDGRQASRGPRGLGECVLKDAWDISGGEEYGQYQLLVVDEKGNIQAQSKQTYSLGHALDLVERLPLRVSPHAEQWLKDALGEAGPAEAGPATASSKAQGLMQRTALKGLTNEQHKGVTEHGMETNGVSHGR